MCSVLDLASFDADHVSYYSSIGCKCLLFQCSLHRMLIFVGRFALLQIARTLMLTTSSDAGRIGCFAHSFRLRALFLSPSSNTYRIRCFAHLQQVPDLPRISLYLML